MSTVGTSFYLVVACKEGRYGGLGTPTVRTTSRKPATKADEIAIEVSLELPASLFRRPTLTAHITVPPGQSAPLQITPDVATNIADVLQQQLGLTMRIEAPEQS